MNLPETIPSLAYVIDVAAIKRNMTVVDRIKRATHCEIVLATKAFALPAAFPFMRNHLDGTTASGLYEARLGAEHFGKQVHTFSPAYSESELTEVLQYSDHIYFNSLNQYEQFASLLPVACNVGLRINPQLSLVKNASIYDPSTKDSRFGVPLNQLPEALPERISILHVHNLCENMAQDSVALIEHLMEHAGQHLQQVDTINLGGGHYITHENYDVDALIAAIQRLKERFGVQVVLEPGGALVYNAGYLISTVLDIIENDGQQIAILDTSATCHMPDVLEVPYTPRVVGGTIYSPLVGESKSASKALRDPERGGMHHSHPPTESLCDSTPPPGGSSCSYILTGRTCLTGDVIGRYVFDEPLKVGRRIVFEDMAQYSFVKNTTFNGLPLPEIGLLHDDGSYESVQAFTYEDFVRRVGI